MAEFILKDWHGKEKTFDHETIYVRGTDGELMPFTHGTGNPVLEELEVTENGSYTPSEGVDGFSSVTVNVGAAKIAVLEEHEMTGFAPDSTWGYSTLDQAPSYTINEGEQYYVKWDGVTYPVMLTDGSAAIAGVKYLGNGSAFNLPGNGEPFAIVFVNGMILYTAFNDPKESHTVGIYKDAGEEIILQDKTITENGEYTADDGYDALNKVIVNVPTTEVTLQDKTITENGTYTADDGFAGLGKVIVDVASSGGNVKWKAGVVQLTSTATQRVNFDFGFKPDVLIVFSQGFDFKSSGTHRFVFLGQSRRFADKIVGGSPSTGCITVGFGAKKFSNSFASYAMDEYNTYSDISNADETGFDLYTHVTGYYRIWAIGLGD